MVNTAALRLVIAVGALAGMQSFATAGASAQAKPLPEVPVQLSQSVRDSLEDVRAKLTARIEAYKTRALDFNAACAGVVVGSAQHATCVAGQTTMGVTVTSIKNDKSSYVLGIAALVAALATSPAQGYGVCGLPGVYTQGERPGCTSSAAQSASPAKPESTPGNVSASNASDLPANPATNGKKGTGAFGSNESNPVLEGSPDSKKVETPAIKPDDQLASIEKNKKRAASGSGEAGSVTSGEGFDTPIEKKGKLSDTKVNDPAGTEQIHGMPVVPPDIAKNDKVIREGLAQYNKFLPELNEAHAAVEQAKAERDNAKSPAAKAIAQTALDAANVKTKGLNDVVESAIQQVKERTVYLGKLPVSKRANGGKPEPVPMPTGKK